MVQRDETGRVFESRVQASELASTIHFILLTGGITILAIVLVKE